MILKLILSVLLLYYLCVLWKYYRTDIAGLLGKTDAEERTDEPDEEAEKPDEPDTVIGKSTYRERQTYEPEDKRDTLKIKRIKRIISHPERRRVLRKRLRITARNRRKNPLRTRMRTTPTSR